MRRFVLGTVKKIYSLSHSLTGPGLFDLNGVEGPGERREGLELAWPHQNPAHC